MAEKQEYTIYHRNGFESTVRGKERFENLIKRGDWSDEEWPEGSARIAGGGGPRAATPASAPPATADVQAIERDVADLDAELEASKAQIAELQATVNRLLDAQGSTATATTPKAPKTSK